MDFLVEFDPEIRHPFKAYFDLKGELDYLFKRPVDLVEAAALKNPYVTTSIRGSAKEIYAA